MNISDPGHRLMAIRQQHLMEVIWEVTFDRRAIRDTTQDKELIREHLLDTAPEYEESPPPDNEIDAAIRRLVYQGRLKEILLRSATDKRSPRHPGTVTRSIFVIPDEEIPQDALRGSQIVDIGKPPA